MAGPAERGKYRHVLLVVLRELHCAACPTPSQPGGNGARWSGIGWCRIIRALPSSLLLRGECSFKCCAIAPMKGRVTKRCEEDLDPVKG